MKKQKGINLDKKQFDLLKKLLTKYIPDKTVWAYGSRVNGKAEERSDLDLAVFNCTPVQIMDLKYALEESRLLISVDVMDWNHIPDSFKENIKKQYIVLQESNHKHSMNKDENSE